MADTKSNVTVKDEPKAVAQYRPWYPFDSLRQEIDRVFDDFGGWRAPFGRTIADFFPAGQAAMKAPAVDIAEKDGAYEITAEMPGIDEKDIDVTFARGMLAIKGEKKDEKEETKKSFHLTERRYGSFERRFSVPDGVDAEKIAATFKNGVLTITLPKDAKAREEEKKIAVKPA